MSWTYGSGKLENFKNSYRFVGRGRDSAQKLEAFAALHRGRESCGGAVVFGPRLAPRRGEKTPWLHTSIS